MKCIYARVYDYTLSLTLSWAWILAPLSARSVTTSERPFKAAAIRGVAPSYQTQNIFRRWSITAVAICLPWPRCLPPGPGEFRRPGGGLPEQQCGGQSIHSIRNTVRQHVKQIHGVQILYIPHMCNYIHVCMIMHFPLHSSGPGYWLHSGRVVPPPQSDH